MYQRTNRDLIWVTLGPFECICESRAWFLNLKKGCHINWRDVQRKNIVNNVDMSSLRTPWQNGPYKNQHTERHKNTKNTMTQQTLRKCYWFVFFGFLYNFLNEFSKKCWVTALIRSMTFIGSFNQVYAIANLTLPSTFLGEKKRKMHLCPCIIVQAVKEDRERRCAIVYTTIH